MSGDQSLRRAKKRRDQAERNSECNISLPSIVSPGGTGFIQQVHVEIDQFQQHAEHIASERSLRFSHTEPSKSDMVSPSRNVVGQEKSMISREENKEELVAVDGISSDIQQPKISATVSQRPNCVFAGIFAG